MIIVRAPRTISGRMPSVTRLRSSAGATADHCAFGTMPNINPPSIRRKPSDREISSSSPRVNLEIAGGGCLTADRLADPRLLELDQHAVRRRGMDERDRRAFRAWPRMFVDQPDAARSEMVDCGADVVDPQRDVVEAGTALVDIPRDRRLRRRRLEQLELRLPNRDEMRANLLARHLLGGFDLEAERVTVERQRGGQIFHGDADVVEDSFHGLGNWESW